MAYPPQIALLLQHIGELYVENKMAEAEIEALKNENSQLTFEHSELTERLRLQTPEETGGEETSGNVS